MRRALAALTLAAGIVTVTLSAAPGHTTAGTPAPAYALCTEEDGSGPQTFPCYWSGGSNGTGRTYVLVAPVCSEYEIALSDASHARGHDIRLACDDLESLTGSF
jgi:hypothetical protein